MSTETTEISQAPTAENAPPVPFMAGTFALYHTPDGGIMLVTETPDQGVQKKLIPAAMVKMAMGGGGMAGSMMRKMFGRGE